MKFLGFKHFFPYCRVTLILLSVSFVVNKLFRYSLTVFIVVVTFVAWFLVTHTKNYCSRSVSRSLANFFLLVVYRFKIYVCLSSMLSWFLYMMRDNGLISLFLHGISSFLNPNYWRNTLHCVFLVTLLKISWP